MSVFEFHQSLSVVFGKLFNSSHPMTPVH